MNMTSGTFGKTAFRALAIGCAALALATGAQAQGHGGRGGHFVQGGGFGGYHGGGYHGPRYGYRHGGNGWVWGGVGLGLGLGLASYYNSYPYYADPGYVVVNPPVVYDNSPPVVYGAPVPARSAPQPVIYPRTGQGAAQTDADANACSQWAGQQPNATVDASVFRRATEACMDARGYTVR
ncbi:MAG: hypothetical protein ABI887_14240 [Burkholderiales bacterium]